MPLATTRRGVLLHITNAFFCYGNKFCPGASLALPVSECVH